MELAECDVELNFNPSRYVEKGYSLSCHLDTEVVGKGLSFINERKILGYGIPQNLCTSVHLAPADRHFSILIESYCGNCGAPPSSRLLAVAVNNNKSTPRRSKGGQVVQGSYVLSRSRRRKKMHKAQSEWCLCSF